MKLQLNLALVKLSKVGVDGFVRPFGKDDLIGRMRAELPEGWECYLHEGVVYSWRYEGTEGLTSPWTPSRITLDANARVLARLVETGVTRALERTGFETVKRKVPVLVRTVTNLLDGRLTTPIDRRVAIHPVYTFETFIKGNQSGSPSLYLWIGSKTQWRMSIPVSDLASAGFSCVGAGVRLVRTGLPPELKHLAGKAVGVVNRVDGQFVELDDPYDVNVTRVPANLVRPEAGRRAFKEFLQKTQPAMHEQLWKQVLQVDEEESKPANLMRRVRAVAKHLGAPFTIAEGVTAEVAGLAPPTLLRVTDVAPTNFVFGYADKATDTLASRGLRNNGPYDKGHSPLKHSRFLILCPRNHAATARSFFKKLQDGVTYPGNKRWYDFPGFTGLFRLPPVTFVEEYYDPADGGSIGKSCELSLKRVLQRGVEYDVCFSVTEEAHKELDPANDPYCIAKGMLLAHGIPVSELTIEDMRSDDWKLAFVLPNIALQAYAKMGGIPFVIEAPKDDRLEVILGIGRADVGSSRFGRKRVIGFATAFKNNGDYLVGAVRPFKDSDDYADEFAEVIIQGVREALQREGLKAGAQVRLVFHVYKQPGKSKEIEAAQKAISKIVDHPVEYAFVHVSDSHPNIVIDESEKNAIPPRRKAIHLTPYSRLVTLIGPDEYLHRGTPTPLKVSIDKRSTFQDTDRLVQQVYDFANVTWRGFNIAVRPVTIHYAQLAAGLAGRLQQTPHWHPTMMDTLLRDKRWFL